MGLRLVYFDHEVGGYHPGHIKLFAEHASRDPRIDSCKFVVGAGLGLDGQVFLENISHKYSKIVFEIVDAEFVEQLSKANGAFSRGRVIWQKAASLSADNGGAICFVSLFDQALGASFLDVGKGVVCVSGIVHAPGIHIARHQPVQSLMRAVVKFISIGLSNRKKIPKIFAFDDKYVESWRPIWKQRVELSPDPLPISGQELSRLFSMLPPVQKASEIQNGDRVKFLMFGSLGRRKGIFTLIEAIRRIPPSELKRFSFEIAGSLTEASSEERDVWRQAVAELSANSDLELAVEDRFLAHDELLAALERADVVLAPYHEHTGTSSVVLWAAAAGRPVISQDVGWMGWAVSKHLLGATCDSTNASSLAEAIVRFGDVNYRTRFEADRLRMFAAGHTGEAFYDAIISGLYRITG